jgi:hypothetical protein
MCINQEMYEKYGKYTYVPRKPQSVCCAPAPIETPTRPYYEQGAIPESLRLRNRQCLYTVPCGTSINPCENNPGRCLEPSAAPVEVGTVAASTTTALRRDQTLYAASDPTNPNTRFESYFRPLPPQPVDLVVGPERLPNKDPITPDRPCVGTSRFGPSVQT